MMKFACFEKTVVALYECGSQAQGRVFQGRAAYCDLRSWLHCWRLLCHCLSPCRVLQGRTAYCDLRSWLHCWRLLRHRLPPRRHPCLLLEQGSWCRHWCCCQNSRLWWPLAGTWTQDYHDRNPDRSSVVHLRWCEGPAPPSPPTSPRDARLPEGQDGCCSVLNTDSLSLLEPNSVHKSQYMSRCVKKKK